MKSRLKFALGMFCLLAGSGAALFLAGCQHSRAKSTLVFKPVPELSSGSASAGIGDAGNKFQVGDLVSVNFSGVEMILPPHEERVKDDGTITLPLINSVKVENKTPGEVQRMIRDLYVPRYYRNLTITVQSQNQYFYVGGEVKAANRYPYLGETTVLKAVQSAGDFTDFANKHKVKLTHVNGRTIVIDCLKAIEHPELDPPVYPGDKIYVPRRLF